MFDSGDRPHQAKQPEAPAQAAPEAPPPKRGSFQDEVMEACSLIAAAQGRLLELLGDEDKVMRCAADDGNERWLSWAAGITPSQARHQLALATALKDLPKISAALSAGEISYEKAAIIAPLACEETEDDLLMWAKTSAAWDLKKMAMLVRRGLRRTPDDPGFKRELRHYFGADGSFNLRARLSPEDGKIVAAALEHTAKTLLQAETAEHPEPANDLEEANLNKSVQETRAARDADALVALSHRALADPEGAPTWVPGAEIVVHVDVETLVNDEPGLSHIDGNGLSAETVRYLGCDGSIQTLIERDGKPLTLGRKRRTISRRQRRALQGRDTCCRVPGCGATVYTQAHHIEDWIKGGRTDIEDLIRLCYRHHRDLHAGRLEIRVLDGEIRFFRSNGTEVAEPPRSAIPIGILEQCRREWTTEPRVWATGIESGDLWAAADHVLKPLLRRWALALEPFDPSSFTDARRS